MQNPKYYVSEQNQFVIENYNLAPSFSSFFPGIAGIFGSPMWVFYANRGQAIACAGVKDKNGAIMEFQPANKAYRTVSLTGFRTFLKIKDHYYEPFAEHTKYKKTMLISPDHLVLKEENHDLKVKVEVTYFTLPGESFPALVRKLKVTCPKKCQIEVLDGLPVIIPFGFSDDLLKRICQTIEAWCSVENTNSKTPFYRLKVIPADASETKLIEKGHFFISFSKEELASVIVEPAIIFNQTTSFTRPDNFIDNKNFKVPASQVCQGFTPCAFAHKKETSKEFELISVIGRAENLKELNAIKKRVTSKGYIEKKFQENQELIGGICQQINTKSAFKNFDLYAQQTYLDNIMRGGLPINIGDKNIYLYYRKHGDMERDYNDFKLMPTYFSQGNGNYRDISQNRRCDIFFNPEAAEDNIVRFFNLVQLDGYNPLVVLGSKFFIKSESAAQKIIKRHLKKDGHKLTEPFILGELLKSIPDYKTSKEEFAKDLLKHCEVKEEATHGEGFWIDHFFYNTDLLESYACVFPDKLKNLLFNKPIFTFYDNDHVVVDRKEKYVLKNKKVRQYESVKTAPTKAKLGKFKTTLAAKIICAIVNKAASFDAEGIGLEMEAEKPDWYDALNGLPGLLGSSLSETLELKRICLFLLNNLDQKAKVKVPVEIKDFIAGIYHVINVSNPFKYWKLSYQMKETYRNQIKSGLSNKETIIGNKYLADFLKSVINKCSRATKKCLTKYKNYYTYFINEATSFEELEDGSIEIKKFKQKPLPLFLEGFVHALKVEKDKKIYARVKRSPLYDKKLNMYKVNAPLDKAPIEIGRCKIFTPGWLENESIWLHMEYKYLLELLKAGFYKEFFNDFQTCLIPFLKPETYKRSILENSSFIVSSANPNKKNHGRGFAARLSGAAAEFIDIWVLMTTGKEIFHLDKKGKLCFCLRPKLPAWLFKKGEFSFKLFGSIDITYINKKKKNTYDKIKPVLYKLYLEDDEAEVKSICVSEPYSKLIRDRKVKKIVVTLA